ncbi:glutamyl-tRNA synthetase [Ignisphaera aggregans DSM 17230]|uniref:Glutamate--tRNA ligase n=1 Tax=Ignisphaera aggregans (strain DSM 17230 / JCM 13409 / AQ1.S1) TaxID=583356 RepID=E0SQA3_IGNAA|nr:glutamyl-tRNA synthetase [Ignisphaera aggregans DSM 17230]
MSSSSPDVIIEEIKNKAYRYAIQNRLRYGQAKTGPVLNKVLGEIKEAKSYIKEIAKIIDEIVNNINLMSLDRVRELALELGIDTEETKIREEKSLPPLPNVDKWPMVVTRFAPNPDFPIHLGNARAAILSYEYARMYKGRFILRFEDTDPRIKTPLPEAYEIIRNDLIWLGIKWDEEYIQSLRMEIYYDIVKQLIEKNLAYVDLCKPEVFREYRNLGRACPHRNEDASIHMDRFDRILNREYKEGEAVIRIKTDLNHPDPAVRDWVLFRIINTSKHPHPITGDRYVLWPTYNFAAAVDDHLLGVSHILRGKEHALNTVKQLYIYNYMGWRYPEVINFGRVGIEGAILSKSRIKTMLLKNPRGFMGIDDIRFGTIAALRRKGILPETIRSIIMELGIKPTDARISLVNIAASNRKILDPRAKRIFVVCDPVKLIVSGLQLPMEIKIPYHTTHDMGYRTYIIKSPIFYISKEDADMLIRSKYIRLMEFANIAFKEINNGIIYAEVIGGGIEEAKKLGAQIVQWVSYDNMVRVVLYRAEGLAIKRLRCLGESALQSLAVGEIIQMVRLGFGKIEYIGKKLVEIIYTHE